ncbi:MAG: AsmA-like C-terminal region-containing protein [Burkholderiales bacterium]
MLAIAIAVPFLVPVSRFIPELARIASDKLNQPVSIDDLQLHLVPTPRLVATGISVGRRADVTIGELEIVPDLLSLVSARRTVRLIRASRVEMQESVLRAGRSLPKVRGGEPILVERVLLEQVVLHHPTLRLPQFDADVELGEGLRLVQAVLESRDGLMRLHVRPDGNFTFTARNWRLPVGAPLLFEMLALQGSLQGEQLDFSSVEGQLYGGKIAGSLRANWTKQWQVSGKAALAGVDLVPVQQALGKPAKLSGRLNAEAAFATQPDGLLLDGPFEVQGGVYQGVDLAKAGDLTGQAAAGDATPFEELTGNVAIRGRQVSLSELCVRSPKLVAGGRVVIGPEQQLSGKLDVSVAKTGGFVGVPVSLGGTTSAPSVSPSKGYVIGALIGTVLMPGLGTTLGATAGSRIEGVSSGCK